jgi:vitamin B12 transporter
VYAISPALQRSLQRCLLTNTALIFCGLLCVTRAVAQQGPPESQPIELPTIVVSPTTIATPTEEVGSSVTVVTGQSLQRDQRRTIADALRKVPGVNVVQTGGPGGQTSVFLRGTNSNQVKVLIDGIDVSNPSVPNGAFDFAHLLTGDIERIEVLRGPQSGLYGADAIGGVISITTKKGEGPPIVTGSAEAGSFGTFNQTAGLSGSQGNINYAFNILHFNPTSVPVTPLNLLAPDEQRINDNYNNWTYSTRLGANLSDNVAVNFIARYTDAKLGFTGEDYSLYPLDYPEAFQSTQVNHNLYSRGEIVWSLFGGKFKNYFGLNYTNQWNWNFNPNSDFAANNGFTSPLIGPPTTNLGERTKFDWRGEIALAPGHTIVAGLESETESVRTNSTGTLDSAFNFTQTTTTAQSGNKAGYIELQSDFAKRFFVVGNIRYDDNESFGPHVTWRVAPALIVPGTETKLKASYGTGFKAPTLTELYINNLAFSSFANPNLLPETSIGYDFGFEQPLLNGRIKIGAIYYHNNITNLINNIFDQSKFVFTYANIGEATTHGIETFADVSISNELRLRAEYTTTITRDETTGLGLRNRPGNKESLTVIWAPNQKFTLSATILHVGSAVEFNRDGTIPRVDSSPYALFNLAANYKVDQHIAIFGRIDNLLNRQYESPLGFLRPGLGVFGGLRLLN